MIYIINVVTINSDTFTRDIDLQNKICYRVLKLHFAVTTMMSDKSNISNERNHSLRMLDFEKNSNQSNGTIKYQESYSVLI